MTEAAQRVTQKLKTRSRDSAAKLAVEVPLSLELLTDLVGEASGYSNGAEITFQASRSLPRVVRATVKISGTEAVLVAGGVDHRAALIALLQTLEAHHRGNSRWHKERCLGVRTILNRYGIYYAQGDL